MTMLDRLLSSGGEIADDTARRARRAVRGNPAGPGWLGAGLMAAAGIAAGAVVAFLMDPARGRGRRARLGDQAAASVRRGVRGAGRLSRRVGRDVRGKVAAMQHAGDEADPFPDDVTLTDRVQSELFRDASVPKGSINVNVERGVVVLRGEVPDDAIRGDLVSRVETMPGVWAVRNLLHLPGEVVSTQRVAAS